MRSVIAACAKPSISTNASGNGLKSMASRCAGASNIHNISIRRTCRDTGSWALLRRSRQFMEPRTDRGFPAASATSVQKAHRRHRRVVTGFVNGRRGKDSSDDRRHYDCWWRSKIQAWNVMSDFDELRLQMHLRRKTEGNRYRYRRGPG